MATEIMNLSEITPDTRISIGTSEQVMALSVNDVLKWIAPGAPPKEALQFLLTCRSARLNPILREAYLVPMGDKWATVIAKGGYLKRAQEHRDSEGRLDYDGHESGVVVQEPARDRTGKILPGQMVGAPIELDGEIVPSGYLLLGGWAKVYRKGISRPIKVRVSYGEYAKNTPPWKQYPGTMIVKVALAHAIKDAFAISDSYDDAESNYIPKNRTPEELAEARQLMAARVIPGPLPIGDGGRSAYDGVDDPTLPPAMLERIVELRGKIVIPDEQWSTILGKYGVGHPAEMTVVQAQAFIQKLEGVASRIPFHGGDAGGGEESGTAGPIPGDLAAGRGDHPGGAQMVVKGEGNATGDSPELVGVGAGDPGDGKYATLPAHDIDG